MSDKVDFKKKFKSLYSPSTEPEIVELPTMKILAIEGRGAPESKSFEQAIQALYGLFFTIKFGRRKQGQGPDYSMGPMEGLWWMGDNTGFDQTKRDEWRWKIFLWVPDFIDQGDLDTAVIELKMKKDNPAIDLSRLETLSEGKAAQIMHIGPYSAEAPSIEKLHHFVEENGYRLRDKHHEIYLSDPRRLAPEKLKTIIRHPIEKT